MMECRVLWLVEFYINGCLCLFGSDDVHNTEEKAQAYADKSVAEYSKNPDDASGWSSKIVKFVRED